jgi:hypothetical protein
MAFVDHSTCQVNNLANPTQPTPQERTQFMRHNAKTVE